MRAPISNVTVAIAVADNEKAPVTGAIGGMVTNCANDDEGAVTNPDCVPKNTK